jgi:formylglycine-generating enzyme required for sulfatase activity/serine/threonine protein kinase
MSTDITGSSGATETTFNPEALKAGDRVAETYVLKKLVPTTDTELPVWIAEDEVSGAEVSLHFVPGEVSGDVKLREALRAEVRRGRQMVHPNILRVHDLLEDGNCVAMVCDPYEGETLARRCAGRPGGALQMAEMESLVRPLVRTLADAHSARMIHRNISPASVVVTAEGHVLVTGFGTTRLIADALQRAGSLSPLAADLLAAVSPNGLRGGKAEVADDLYGLGATLFEVISGRPLFQGPDLGRLVLTEKPLSVADARVLSKLPAIRLFKNWEKVLSSCLAKDPFARPASMTELGVQLGLSDEKLEEENPESEAEQKAKEEENKVAAAAGAEVSEGAGAGPDSSETFSSSSSRPIFIPTASSPSEEGEHGNRFALLVGLLILAAAAGVWIGTNFLMKQEEPEFESEEPAPVAAVSKKDEDVVKFVSPPIPSTGDEVATLRPGLPIRPKPSKDVPGEPEVPDAATPVIPEPPVMSVPQAATAPRSTGKHTVDQELPETMAGTKVPGDASTKSGLEDPLAEERRALESARQRGEQQKQEAGDAALARKEREIIEKATEEAEARAKEMLQRAASMPLPAATAALARGAKPGQTVPPAPSGEKTSGGGAPNNDQREAQRLLAIARGEPPPEAQAGATTASKSVENTLGMRFVPVGNVQFSVYETRVRDFAAFIRETGHSKSHWRKPGFDQTPDHPVVMVSWTDAMAFCKWLTDREHLSQDLPADQYYRLPTDSEWSFAAGLPAEKGQTPELRDLGIQDRYPWGNTWPPPKGAGNYTGRETGSDVAISGYDDGFPYTAPVGSYAPNEKGIYDMGGNAWEWCLDTWNLKTRSRVLRGASWFQGSLQFSLLTSCRVHSMPDRESDNYGFRVVRTSAPAKMR